jgi:hypothetical protein
MKFLSLAVVLISLPVMSFAATRSACYKADKAVPNEIESILCLENISDSVKADIFSVISSDGSFPAEMNVTSITRHNEERFAFTIEGLIHDEWNSGCSDGVSANAIIKGKDDYGFVDVRALDITVEITTTNDTCHSEGTTETVHYTLVK